MDHYQKNVKTMYNVEGYVVVQFYPWFKFCFPLFLGMVMNMMNDNEFETKENEIYTKDKIELRHIQPRSQLR